LRIEPLEVRNLMDAAGVAALVTPAWFGSVQSGVAAEHAGVAAWTAENTVVSSSEAGGLQTAWPGAYDWIVQFDTAALSGVSSVAETASLLVGGGIDFQVRHGLGLVGQVLVRSSGADLEAVEGFLRNDAYVASFEQDALRQEQVQPNDPQLGSLWGMSAIDAQNAWTISKGSSSVVVAVIDTGVDYNHPDLAANIWTNPGEIAGNGIDDDHNGFLDDVHGYDFANHDGNPMDDNGHGTHVSGTIAAVGNNGRGVSGVNWSSSIMALKFMNAQGAGYLSDAIAAVNYATMMRTQYGVNVRVDNNSWGGGGFSAALQSAIQASNQAGILFVAAAGNSAANNDAVAQYPANYDSPNVISVAALAQNGQLASFSNYGATSVDIAAPGVSIYSTVPNNGYAYYSGTSMAAPQVSGVAALCWAAAPNASVADVRNAILRGADTVAALNGKVASGGTLDAYRTLQLLSAAQPQGPVVSSLTAAPGAVTAGTALTLSAGGITDAGGAVTQVLFYRDANNNGQYDATDPLVASTTALSGGTASVTVSTTGLAAGTYRFFAKAVDNHSRSSAMASAAVTVLAADDFGNNAAAAGAIAPASSTSGKLEVTGDVDWFKFQATAGQTYVFGTVLGTLRDSVLSLYDRNGQARLAFNDDCGSSLSSQIVWTARANGTYYLVVGGYGGKLSGSYVLGVQTPGSTTVQSKATAAGLSAFGPGVADVPAVPLAGLPDAAWARMACAGRENGDRSNLCDDHASMVPASGPFRQIGPVPLFPAAAFGPAWGQGVSAVLHDEVFAGQTARDALPVGRQDPLRIWDGGLGQSLTGRLDEVRLVSVGRRSQGTGVSAEWGEDAASDAALLADGLPRSGLLERDAVDAIFGLSPGERECGQEIAEG
jgi:subtilisin family serine protease